MKAAYHALKRLADLALILLASPLILVLTAVIAVIIRISSGRQVLFAQERAGRSQKPFTLYKFRTMRINIDPFGPSPKGGEDPRITPIGKWLRLTSLDELPQLWNVLTGEMALIGPRPLYMAQAAEWNTRQRRRLEVKPGLTGLAQVSGRGALTIEDKLELDVQYVERESLWLDLKILFTTAAKLVFPVDIYEKQYSRMEKTRSQRSEHS